MTINELRNKRAKLWEGTKAFLETHRKTHPSGKAGSVHRALRR